MEEYVQMSLAERTALALKLQELKPKIRKLSSSGDDNHNAIDMQIKILLGAVSEESLDTMLDNKEITSHAYNCGSDAFQAIHGTLGKDLSVDWVMLAVASQNSCGASNGVTLI
jgi:hypothetical protein